MSNLSILTRSFSFILASTAGLLVTFLLTDLAAQESLCGSPRPTGTTVGELSDPEIDESSGLADSWLSPNRLYTHNDSGDQPRLWALDKTGAVHTLIRLEGAENIDWEDMAIAPCSAEDARPCIYIGDFGDNLSRRDHVVIYRFPEPDFGDTSPEELVITEFERLRYRYDLGPRDAETLLVHPETRQIWVIEKTGNEEVLVFEVPEDFSDDEILTVSSVATLTIQGPLALTRMVTAGDISPDGREFSYRTYLQLYTHCVPEGERFEAAFETRPLRQNILPATIQGEALTYDRQDHSIWLTSEQLPAPLIRIPSSVEEEEELPEDETDPGEGDSNTSDEESPEEDSESDQDQEMESSSTPTCSQLTPLSGPLSFLFFGLLLGLLRFRRFLRSHFASALLQKRKWKNVPVK